MNTELITGDMFMPLSIILTHIRSGNRCQYMPFLHSSVPYNCADNLPNYTGAPAATRDRVTRRSFTFAVSVNITGFDLLSEFLFLIFVA